MPRRSGTGFHKPRQRATPVCCARRMRPLLLIQAQFSCDCDGLAACFFYGERFGIGRAAEFFHRAEIAHFGARGRQTSAPSSMRAELKRPPLRLGCNASASAHKTSRPAVESIGMRRSSSRARTRAILASTMGVETSNANVAMAPAVYLPMPGSLPISAGEGGHFAVVFAHHDLRGAVEFARAGVVAEALPLGENFEASVAPASDAKSVKRFIHRT